MAGSPPAPSPIPTLTRPVDLPAASGFAAQRPRCAPGERSPGAGPRAPSPSLQRQRVRGRRACTRAPPAERARAGRAWRCPLRRSVARRPPAPRRPRRRLAHPAHLLPWSPPPPGLDGGPPPSATQKTETRRRRHLSGASPGLPARPRSRRRGPAPALSAVGTPPPPRPGLPGHGPPQVSFPLRTPRRAMFKKLKQKISEEQQLQQALASPQVRRLPRPLAPAPGRPRDP